VAPVSFSPLPNFWTSSRFSSDVIAVVICGEAG
jgi:hypothetical protein